MNPEYHSSSNEESFTIPERDDITRAEEMQDRREHRIRTGEMIAEILRDKMLMGDLHYGNLYDHRHSMRLHRDVRAKLMDVLEPHEAESQ